MSSCDSGSMGGSCVIGPCTPRGPISEFEFRVVGTPNLDPQGSGAVMKTGDSITLYFVRRRWWANCAEPADTLAGGNWSITGPGGQFGDFSNVASVTAFTTHAVVLAKSPGHFAIRYLPAENSGIPSYSVLQTVQFCPGPTAVMDIQVIP